MRKRGENVQTTEVVIYHVYSTYNICHLGIFLTLYVQFMYFVQETEQKNKTNRKNKLTFFPPRACLYSNTTFLGRIMIIRTDNSYL